MHIKKYILPILFAVLVCCAMPSMAQQGKSKKQLEKERAQLEAEIRRLNGELARAKKNTRLTNSQLAALNKKINERNRLIDNINGQLSQIDVQISQMNDSITAIQSRRQAMQYAYAATVRSLYKEYNNMDRWVLLFDSPSYNHALLRRKYFKRYNEYRLQQARAIRLCEQQLIDVSSELQRQKDEQSNLLGVETRQRDQLAREQRQKEASVRQSRANERQIANQLSTKEAQKKQLQKQIQRIIDEEVRRAAEARAAANRNANRPAANNPAPNKPAPNKPAPTTTSPVDKTTAAEAALSNDFASNKGKLAWPVVYTSISRNYGRYTHESGGENMNNGIDLVTVQGTNVYAVFKGTVSRTFTCPNGTIGIIIRHGDYMTVYCNLASASVKAGQKVNTRAVIGTVASDGNGHGEFSFQLWKGRESQNPRAWLR